MRDCRGTLIFALEFQQEYRRRCGGGRKAKKKGSRGFCAQDLSNLRRKKRRKNQHTQDATQGGGRDFWGLCSRGISSSLKRRGKYKSIDPLEGKKKGPYYRTCPKRGKPASIRAKKRKSGPGVRKK